MTITKAIPRRFVWYWVNFVFNRVDRSRIEAIGPERTAAEWILRLGGTVKFKGFKHWNSDYNRLPSGPLHLEAIDATGLSVTSNGLEHLDGLTQLNWLSLSKCKYLSDDGITFLHHIDKTLQFLDLSHCTALTSKGLNHLTTLQELRHLDISGMATTEKTVLFLQNSLSHCKIIT